MLTGSSVGYWSRIGMLYKYKKVWIIIGDAELMKGHLEAFLFQKKINNLIIIIDK